MSPYQINTSITPGKESLYAIVYAAFNKQVALSIVRQLRTVGGVLTRNYLRCMVDLSKDWTAEDIKNFLDEHSFTQTQLAELLGIRIATVSDWVRGVVIPSRLASVALTYLDLDLGGRMKIKG